MSTIFESIQAARMTPRNDDYPSCDRTTAELRIYPSCSADEVSKILGLQPTESGNAGDLRVTGTGKSRTVKKTHWVLSSEASVSSKDLRAHLDWLLEKVTPHSDGLAKLVMQEGTKVCVVCVWWSANGQGGPTLWPEQMKGLADLGIELGFDIQFHDPE